MTVWQSLSQINIYTSVMTLAVDEAGGIWAGGLGGVAWREQYGDWHNRLAVLGVSALLPLSDKLIVGYAEGIVYSIDGVEWETAVHPPHINTITSLAQGETLLAGSAQQGLLQSQDNGQTWQSIPSPHEQINAILWAQNQWWVATTNALFTSSDAQTWHATFTGSVVQVVQLGNGRLALITETDQLWLSHNGQEWTQSANQRLPQGTILSLYAPPKTHTCLIIGIAEQGTFYTVDEGATWNRVNEQVALSLGAYKNKLFAGTNKGFLMSLNGGVSWIEWANPPVHDLKHLSIIEDTLFLMGRYAGLVRYTHKPGNWWQVLPHIPRPILAMAQHQQALYLATSDSILRSHDLGETWQPISQQGGVTHLSIRADGTLFAISSRQLLVIGESRQLHQLPFSAADITLLLAMPHLLLTAVYQNQHMHIWTSMDDGQTWHKSASIKTNWLTVTAHSRPPIFTVGHTLFKQTIRGWQQQTISPKRAPIRLLVGDQQQLVALTTQQMWHSTDGGDTWTQLPLIDRITDVTALALKKDMLYVARRNGRVATLSLKTA